MSLKAIFYAEYICIFAIEFVAKQVIFCTLIYFPDMRNTFHMLSLWLMLLFILSCGGRGSGARAYITEARTAYEKGNYSLAKLKIDSIKILFPEAFDEIDAGFKLMQEIRMAENRRNITYCDSMLRENYAVLNKMLADFDYVRDNRYQEFGEYWPKIYPHRSSLERNGLRSGVREKGALFIESVLSGNVIQHNRIRVTAADDSFVESGVVTADGLNYRFNTLNKNYEIVRYTGNDERGVAAYIHTYSDSPLTVHFIGNRTVRVPLTDAAIKGISRSYELSTLLLDIEQLKFEKERSEVLIRYLESRSDSLRMGNR